MKKSLRLDDALDGINIVKAVEQAFDIKITDKEAADIYSVGEMCDLVLLKMAADPPNRKCASAMAFYRLRRAISDLRVNEKLTPATPLSFLENGRTKSNFKSLEKQSGLRLPQPATTWIGSTGALAMLFTILAILPFYILIDQNVMPEKWLVSLPILFAAGIVALYVDPGQLPKGCESLSGLAIKTARLNYGRMVKLGASRRDEEIWAALLDIILEHVNVPADQIMRETVFSEPRPKAA